MKVIAKPPVPFSQLKHMNVSDFSDYNNCIQLIFTSEKSVDLYDYKSKMKIDTIKENQIHYLDAKAIVLSYQKKYDEYWNNAYEQYNLYPENSHERLESLGVWFKNRGNNDSAVYYFEYDF